MRFIRKDELNGSSRHIQSSLYATTRFLLAADGVGVSVTDITLAPGVEETYGYDDHTEIAYCIEGEARIVDPDGHEQTIESGTMWVAHPGERFRFVAIKPTRLICVFSPPLTGNESGLASDMRG